MANKMPPLNIDDLTLDGNNNSKISETTNDSSKSLSDTSNDDSNLDQDNKSDSSEVISKEEKELINKRKLRIFLVKLAKASKRHDIRMKARQDYNSHINKIKNKIINKPNQQFSIENSSNLEKSAIQGIHHDLDNDIEELKNKVAHLINVERNPYDPTHNQKVKDKIAKLESKLNEVLAIKQERDERFKHLEKKIDSKLSVEKNIMVELEKKLLLLQKKLIQHKIKKGSSSDPEIKEINDRLKLTKEAISKIKSTN